MNKRRSLQNIYLKYIDDLSLAEAINLREKLVKKPDPTPSRPFTFYERMKHVLLTDQLNALQK